MGRRALKGKRANKAHLALQNGDSVTFSDVTAGGSPLAGGDKGVFLDGSSGAVVATAGSVNNAVFRGFTKGGEQNVSITAGGDVVAKRVTADQYIGIQNKCGFTADGELYFFSRGQRYKLVVASNLATPEPWPMGAALTDRLGQKPDTTDIVPGDE